MSPETPQEDERLRDALLRLDDRSAAGLSSDVEAGLSPQSLQKLTSMQRALSLLKQASRQNNSQPPVSAQDTSPVHDRPDSTSEPLATISPSRYRFVRRLGQGGFGIVFLAHDEQLQRHVAVKLPRLDIFLTKSMAQRFLREAQNVARLDHPNIVPVLAVDDSSPMPAIVYHFCSGPTLAKWLSQTTAPVSAGVVARIGLLLAEAIQHAHSRGILHRDIKPSNILLEPGTGESAPHGFHDGSVLWIPRISDFGISKVMQEQSGDTATHAVMGTPEYMSPEQLAGRTQDVGTYSDVYSLGVVLYELLTKARPFAEHSPVDLLIKMRSGSPAPVRKRRPDVSSDLDAVVLHCLNVSEQQRYATAADLAADLRNVLDQKPVSARPQSKVQRLRSWARRQPVVASLSFACILLTLFGLAATGEYIRRTSTLVSQLRVSNLRLKSAIEKADLQKDRADQEAGRALKHSRELAQQLYASDVSAAAQAYRDGDMTRYNALLERHRSPAGDDDLRDLAWHYLWDKGHRKHSRITVCKRPLYCIAFSNDHQRVALCGADGIVRIWDLADRREVFSWDAHQSEVNYVHFSSDDRYVVTAGDDGSACTWQAMTGQLVQRLQVHAGHVHKAIFAPEDRLITCGNEPTIRVWNWRTGKPLGVLEGHAKSVQSIAISTDGQELFSASDDRTIGTWRLDDLSLISRSDDFHARDVDVAPSPIQGSVFWADVAGIVRCARTAENLHAPHKIADLTDAAEAIALSADGRRIAIASREGIIQVVDLDAEARAVSEAPGSPASSGKWVAHQGRVYDLAFSADGLELHSVGEDGIWRIWTPTTERSSATLDVQELFEPESPSTLCVDQISQEKCLFAADTSIFSWNAATNHVQRLADDQAVSSRLVADPGKGLLFTGHVGGQVKAWKLHANEDADKLEQIWEYAWPQDTDMVSGVAYSAARGVVATAVEDQRAIRLLDARSGRELERLAIPEGAGGDNDGGINFSPDGRWLASALDREIVVWDMQNKGTVKRLAKHQNMVSVVCFDPSNPIMVSGSDDRTILVWNLETAEPIAELRHHKDRITSLLMSPDGRILLAADVAGCTTVWHTPTYKLLFELDTSNSHVCLALNWIGSTVFRSFDQATIHADQIGRIKSNHR